MASSLISWPIPGLSFISYLPFTGAQACPCIGNTYKRLVIQFIIRIPHRLKERAEKGTILTNALKMNHVLIRIAHPFLEQLSHKYHETVHSAVQSDNSVIYLDKVESDSSIFINTQMGVKNYMYCTGVGKCLLSYKQKHKLTKSFPSPSRQRHTIQSPGEKRY